MTTINLTPPNFTVTIGGTDITQHVTQLSLRQSAIDIRNPIVWEGSITLADTIDQNIPDTTYLWCRAAYAVVLSIEGNTFCTLRISSSQYNEDTGIRSVQVSQLLKLLDHRKPPEDYTVLGEGTCAGEFYNVIVGKLLSLAGIVSYSLGGAFSTNDKILVPDRVNQSYIQLAQTIAGERGYWLYHDESEVVRWKKMDSSGSSFERSRAQLVEYNPLSQSDILPALYRVVGGGEVCEKEKDEDLSDALNSVEEIYGNRGTVYETIKSGIAKDSEGKWLKDENGNIIYQTEVVATRTEVNRVVVERIETEVTEETLSYVTIKNTYYKTFDLFDTEGEIYAFDLYKTAEVFNSKEYDGQGRLVRETNKKDGIVYKQPSFQGTKYDFYPDALKWVEGLEETITIYSSDPRVSTLYTRDLNANQLSQREFADDVIRLKEVTTYKTTLAISESITTGRALDWVETATGRTLEWQDYSRVDTKYEFIKAISDATIETWLEPFEGKNDPYFTYNKKVFKTQSLIIQSSLSEFDPDGTPPSWQTRPPLYPRANARLFAERKSGFCVGAPGFATIANEREQEYSAQSITTDREAQQLVDMLMRIDTGRFYGYEIVMSLREATEFYLSPEPMQRAYFKDKIFVLDSPSLVFDGTEAEMSWEGITVGYLSVPVGEGSGDEYDLTPGKITVALDTTGFVQFSAVPFGATSAPDLSWITIDGSGNITTSGGYIQASQNQNVFAQILVDNSGSVVVSANGNIVSTADDVYGSYWDEILTESGEVLTVDGVILTV